MRRQDREVTDRKELEAILTQAASCRLAFSTEDAPYIVSLSFGFEWKEGLELYFHGAGSGRKLDLMRRDPRVGFQLEGDSRIIKDENPCEWGTTYSSIVGAGHLEELTDEDERRHGLELIMAHYGYERRPHFAPGSLQATSVLRLRVSELSGKKKA